MATATIMATELENEFAAWIAGNFLTVKKDERGWYITHDYAWFARLAKKEGGWIIKHHTELMPDDETRSYFEVLRRVTVKAFRPDAADLAHADKLFGSV